MNAPKMRGRLVRHPKVPAVVAKQIEAVSHEKKLKFSYLWGAINSFLLACVLYDLTYGIIIHGYFYHNVEVGIAVFLCFNVVFHISRIVWISSKDISSKITEPTLDSTYAETHDNAEFTCFQRSNYDIVSVDKSQYWSSSNPTNISNPDNLNSSFSPFNTSKATKICSLHDLDRYLKEYKETEKSAFVASSIESPSSIVNQYWSGTEQLTQMDVSPIFRRTIYQSSYCSSESGLSLNDDGGSPICQLNTELWLKYKINPSVVVTWVSNLRMWISSTILQRIVEEIDTVNNGLRTQGLGGLAVGHVGLDTLTNTAHNMSVSYNIPTLASLIPFLEVSSNQQYVVQRIKELAIGSAMSDYKWKSGNKYWEPHLPTDSEIIMHSVCTYLDSQLPLLSSAPESRPFTTKYILKSKDQMKEDLAIFQHSVNPPHYQLIINNSVQEIPPGRNNLFYALLLFIHLVKVNKNGMLERINLGPSGINMLWTVSALRPSAKPHD